MASQSQAQSGRPELVITRIFNAPRELVFRMWVEREHMERWGGPKGLEFSVITMDRRPGGAYRFRMREPNGTDHWSQGVCQEIVPSERFVFTAGWTDADGNPTSPVTLVTLTFEDVGGKTKFTLRQTGFENAAERDSHRTGYESTLDKLAEYLATL